MNAPEGLDPTTIIYGQVMEIKTELRALSATSAPLARLESAEREIDGLKGRVEARLREREEERAQAFELLKIQEENEGRVSVQRLVLYGAIAVALISQIPDLLSLIRSLL